MKTFKKTFFLSTAFVTLSLGAFAQSNTNSPVLFKIDPSATKADEKISELEIQPRNEKASIHSAEIDKKNDKATISIKDEKGIITKKEVYELKQEKK